MNKKQTIKAIAFLSLVVIAFFFVTPASAYSDNGTYFTCYNCSDCTDALNNNTYSEVRLGVDIANCSGNCIDNPGGFSGKTFDGWGHTIDGIGTNKGIVLTWGNKNNNIIRNCTFTDFVSAIRFDSTIGTQLINNSFHSKIHTWTAISNATYEGNRFYDGAHLSIYTNNLGDNISIQNNTFEGTTYLYAIAVQTDNSYPNNLTISNNYFNNLTGYGMSLCAGNNTIISGNVFTNVSIRGVTLSKMGLGTMVTNNVFQGNTADHSTGISTDDCANTVLVDNNTIVPPYVSVGVMTNSKIILTNNTITTDGTCHGGLYISGERYIKIKDNTIWNIDFEAGLSSALIQNNTIDSLEFKGSNNITIIDNNISTLMMGWWLSDPSRDSNISNNTICHLSLCYNGDGDVYNNVFERNNFSACGYDSIVSNSTKQVYNNTFSSNIFNTTSGKYATKLYNSTNNIIEGNSVLGGEGFKFYSDANNNKGCNNIGSIVDEGDNCVYNITQGCHNCIWTGANEWILTNTWGSTNQTFEQIDTNLTNDTAYSWYNSTSGEWMSYWSGYNVNKDITIPKHASLFVYIDTASKLECVESPTENVSIPTTAWYHTPLRGNVTAYNLTAINASIVSDSCVISAIYAFDNSTQAYTSTGSYTVDPNEGFCVYATTGCTWDGSV